MLLHAMKLLKVRTNDRTNGRANRFWIIARQQAGHQRPQFRLVFGTLDKAMHKQSTSQLAAVTKA